MQYDKFTTGQRISVLDMRIEELERQHAERDILITGLKSRLNVAVRKHNQERVEMHSSALESMLYEQEEAEQVLRLLIAEREELLRSIPPYP